MKSRLIAAFSVALLASAFLTAPVTTYAGGNIKAKCEAKAKKKKIANKDMAAYMKKCTAKKKEKAKAKGEKKDKE